VARALRFQGNLPIHFWGECVLTTAYLINRTPSRLLKGRSPYEILFSCKPSYNEIRVFGTLCSAQHNPRVKDKFASRSKKCVFLEYPFGKKGWKVYDLETQKIFVRRDVKFCEDKYPFEEATINNEGQGRQQPTMVDDFRLCEPSVHWPSESTRTEGPVESGLIRSPSSHPVQPAGTPADRGSSELGLVDLQENGAGQIVTKTANSERTPVDLPNVEHGPLLSQAIANFGLNTLHSSRSCRPSAHLNDYVCYNTSF